MIERARNDRLGIEQVQFVGDIIGTTCDQRDDALRRAFGQHRNQVVLVAVLGNFSISKPALTLAQSTNTTAGDGSAIRWGGRKARAP
ncbi:hypothetical protein DLM46_32450 [Paraburkholderia lacunae]|uniref:Uncharacterized protein n=1 Tax=Paraburkholderia lacunae TaxID=2211104 RepID=A0A370MZF1_9BURK|nr:hypothetical protein DLM46_32450 [Paraburkholderia lacunae]